jgi:hypothetical protein
MKRTLLLRIARSWVVIVLLAATCAVCAEEVPKAPAGGEALSSPVKDDIKESAEGAATVGADFTVTLKAPLGSPLFDDFPIVTVNDAKITLSTFTKNLDLLHQKIAETQTPRKKSFSELLQRLITIELIIQEARNMGLDQLPEIKQGLDEEAKILLNTMVREQHVKDIKPDEKEVEKAYLGMSREVKLQQVMFKKEEDAKKFEQAVRAGGNFGELAEKGVKEGIAEKPKGEDYVRISRMSPDFAKIISTMQTGSVSAVVPNLPKFVVFRLEDAKNADDPAIREQARRRLRDKARAKAVLDYRAGLYGKYLKQNTKLIKALDFEARKPGFAKLLKDKRVLVAIKGEKPITVAELADALRGRFTHGVERALKENKVNAEKMPVLESMMARRVFHKAALDTGVDKSREYTDAVDEMERGVLFGLFVEKVIKPDIKIPEADLKEYYNAHLKEYTYPAMLKIKTLDFKTSDSAKKSIEKLRKGMDFKWLKANAEDLAANDDEGGQVPGEHLVTVTSLPDGMQKALAGVTSEDFRLYDDPRGFYEVVYVEKVIPATQQLFEDVVEKIGPIVYGEKLTQSIKEWSKKLAEANDIKIYVDFGK